MVGTPAEGGHFSYTLSDPSHDGNYVSAHGSFFADGYEASVAVWEYWGDNTAADAYGQRCGIAFRRGDDSAVTPSAV